MLSDKNASLNRLLTLFAICNEERDMQLMSEFLYEFIQSKLQMYAVEAERAVTEDILA